MPSWIGCWMLSPPLPSSDAGRRMQNGLADLTLERRAGRTRLTRSRTRPPLLVQQALYPDDGAPDLAYVFLANPTGGLLENDRQEISVTVGAGARAHFTTQSATKVHTMIDGVAEQHVSIDVAAGGYLEYLPDPLIPFQDASLVQSVRITLEPGAMLVYGDALTPGRVASGEAFQYRRISNRLAVHRRSARPSYLEAYDLVGPNKQPMGMAALGVPDPLESGAASVHTYASMLILCDAGLAGTVLTALRESLPACGGVSAGASTLPDGNGVGVKIVGVDCAAAQAAMTTAWSIARQALIGSPTTLTRKY